MPPKGGGKGKTPAKDANLKKKIREKRASKPEAFSEQLISEFNVRRGRLVAKQYGIKNASKHSFPSELVPLIKEKMLLCTDCSICDGQCQPESHKFPAVKPVVSEEVDDEDLEDEEEEDSDSSGHSRGSVRDGPGDSPSRSVFNDLGNQNLPDSQILGGSLRPFADHALEQLGGSVDPHAVVPPTTRRSSSRQSEPRQSTSKDDDGSEDLSSSSEEDEDSIHAKIKEREEIQKKEIADAKKAALTSQKKAAEKEKKDRRKRKQDRAAARAATEKRILDEMDKKHKATLAAIRASVPGDDDVFIASPGPAKSTRASKPDSRKSSGSTTRQRKTSKVSFDSSSRKPRSPRSSSEHSDQEYHPAYRGSSRSHSVAGTSVEMDVIMELMDRQSKQFDKSTKVMAAALERVAESGASRRVSIASLSGFEDSTDGASGGASSGSKKNSAGTLKMISSGKSKMARALGVNPGMKLAFTGDTDNIDVSKLQKNMQSGKHRKTGTGFCVRQHVWAHDVVSRASAHLWPKKKPGHEQEFGHWDQSFANFQEGFCQKILIDHEDDIKIEIQNKLLFQSFMIRQAYILPWEDILSIIEQFFEAYEYEVVEWDNWNDIEKFLNQACEQARLSTFARNNVPAALAAPGQNPIAQPAKKFEGNIKGVTWKYMKDKKICCGFNTGSCEQQDGHTIGKGTVNHWCGGCHGASKGVIKEKHPAKTCGKGPWNSSLFQ